MPYFCWIDSGPIFYMSWRFFCQITTKKTCLYVHEKWIWLFGIFDKPSQGCDEVKNSMGLLQGPRLMAWTTKSPIWGNHWVPWGCRAHLGSVKNLTKKSGNKDFRPVCLIILKKIPACMFIQGCMLINLLYNFHPVCLFGTVFYSGH